MSGTIREPLEIHVPSRFDRLFFFEIRADKFDNMKRFFKIVTSFVIGSFSFSGVFAETVHIVKRGETLYSISRTYGVSVEDVQKANGLADNNVRIDQKLSIPDAGSRDGASSSKADYHVVKKDETLYSISRTYGVTVDNLKDWNGLSGNNVKIGQKLIVSSVVAFNNAPTAVKKSASPEEVKSSSKSEIYYTAQKGDTWLGIALEHGLTLSEIQELNNVTDADMIKVGQRVKLSNVPDLKDNDPRVYSKKGDASLVWPVQASDVTYVTGKVNGVSLLAKKNETVRSIASGTVMVAGAYRGYGNVVFVQGKSGYIYAYTGLGNVHVSKGDTVSYGGDVGTVGLDAYTDSPQVSLMVFRNSTPVDPAKAPRG